MDSALRTAAPSDDGATEPVVVVIDDLSDLFVRTAEAEARLVAALQAMETVPIGQYRKVVAPAGHAERLATEWDLPDLRMRARLVRADVLLRDGDAVEAGRIARQAIAWATERDDSYLLARSHRQLALFFYLVGDMSDALAHAVQCVAHTGEDVPARLRANHLSVLAMVLHDSGSPEDARRRNEEALEIAVALGDGELSLQILNNLAYYAYQDGDPERAEHLIPQIRAVSARYGLPLDAGVLDTVARIEMTHGRYVEAVETLRPFLDGSAGHLLIERNALAECLLTVAEAQRLSGDIEAAQASLDRAVEVCEERNLGSARARVREEQAQVYAATGRHAEAYEEYRLFHTETQALQSAHREARARTLLAVFETEEARRESRRFREMARRDPLTGLYNRRFLDERLPLVLEQAAERGAPLSVALVDLDHFKRINDTLSHATGDAVLKGVAGLLADAVAGPAIAARLGGEEFVLVLPDTDVGEAARRCQRLRRAIADHGWQAVTGDLPVTASIGVATVLDGRGSAAALLAQADRNLYAAKRAGRNRVVADPAGRPLESTSP
ncbi:diguanylate cyclase [Planosporangium thailandense]|uniref:Diguanylate cyclase n=1 Tax=Planosporangium thailandense TaxID=765197 RepID=A0ABX0XXB2_9ACTN|nr:GGDEF domain-containing protein [Planosporangium thailandense]NJC70693.1 diguanylate cyclase [Planosporangium thailandense]